VNDNPTEMNIADEGTEEQSEDTNKFYSAQSQEVE